MDLKEALVHSLVFETTGILEQPSNTLLLQIIFYELMGVTLSNAHNYTYNYQL